MRTTSEWVSLGHPDKTADYVSSYILDRHLERDPETRYAVEVQIKDNFVSIAGEVTSRADYTDDDIAQFACEAVSKVGYTPEYQKRWGGENAVSADELVVAVHVSQQSPDIAVGVNAGGWGDQGIFWGMAENDPKTGFMPFDRWLAEEIGRAVVASGVGGIDVKTQVSLGEPPSAFAPLMGDRAIVAVPLLSPADSVKVRDCVLGIASWLDDANLTVNGTGSYLRHGPLGDCGTTGRKLAVDFYGGNCRIGGGSPWTKDGTKADLALNLYARYRALTAMRSNGLPRVYCAISCCIGSPEVEIAFYDGQNSQLSVATERHPPEEIIGLFRLREPRYAAMCSDGLFSWMPQI